VFDAVVILYVVINAFLGFRYGLFRRFLHIAAFYVGLLLAQAMSPGLAGVFNYNTGPHPTAGHFFLFMVVLFGLVLVVEGLMFGLGGVLDAFNALIFDRFFGLVVGAIAGVLEMAVFLYLFTFMYATPMPSGASQPPIITSIASQVEGSPTAKALSKLRQYIVVLYGPVLPPEPGTYFAKTYS
jgi:uncharacterized membrane protein required for colicin V production